jgi:hypothetical protein
VADHGGTSGVGDELDVRRVRAEIEAEAKARRRADPELARREREIERVWADVAPPGAVGKQQELLLDRFDRLSMVDVDAPIGTRSGIRQVKGVIRKAIYWYLRYLTDQLNALTNVLSRLLRRMDERLVAVEHAVGLAIDDSDLAGLVPAPSQDTAVAIAEHLGGGHVAVLTSGAGSVVAAAVTNGGRIYGIDRDPITILPGVEAGLDLRVADPLGHLDSVETDSLGALVLAGVVETLPLSSIVRMCSEAMRCVGPGGTIVVAVADPTEREPVEAELRGGRGLSPAAWLRVLEVAGASARIVAAPGPRIVELVVADVS